MNKFRSQDDFRLNVKLVPDESDERHGDRLSQIRLSLIGHLMTVVPGPRLLTLVPSRRPKLSSYMVDLI